MRLLSVRLIVSLIVGITLVSSGFSYYEVLAEKRALRSDVERRDEILGESLAGNVEELWNVESQVPADNVAKRAPHKVPKVPNKVSGNPPNTELQQLAQRFGNREHLLGVVIYDRQGAVVTMTPELAKTLNASPLPLTQVVGLGREQSAFVRLGDVPVHVLELPIRRDDEVLGSLAVVHDVSYIRDQILLKWRQTFFRVLAQVFLIVLITLLIIRWSITGPIARAASWMRGLRTGKIPFHHEVPDLAMFRPLAREVATLAESLNQARNRRRK